MAVGDVVS